MFFFTFHFPKNNTTVISSCHIFLSRTEVEPWDSDQFFLKRLTPESESAKNFCGFPTLRYSNTCGTVSSVRILMLINDKF